MISRFSSLQRESFQSFLPERLKTAKEYRRISGYFSSSILEIAGEELENLEGKTTIICNAEIDHSDLAASKGDALKEEFYQKHGLTPPTKLIRERLLRFAQLVETGKLEVRIVGNDKYGLIHGKGGIITFQDGRKSAFIGSANDTWKAWAANYELVWEDDSQEAVAWMEQEFEMLLQYSIPMPEWTLKEVIRLGESITIEIDEWLQGQKQVDTVLTPLPLYRQSEGLRSYQEWFVDHIYTRYLWHPLDARMILADEVGLGKTLQLALAATLITLKSQKPCLILVPKTLTEQWQIELADKLALPSARWTGKYWVTETGEELPKTLGRCPRKIGIVSHGLINHSDTASAELLNLEFGCVVIDEAHRARTNLQTGEHNRMMAFLHEISKRTEAMLLGTANPVQLDIHEAYELLNALSAGSPYVLGNEYSPWRLNKEAGLQIAQGQYLPTGKEEWEWTRNPLPSPAEHQDFKVLRQRLEKSTTAAQAYPEDFLKARTKIAGTLPHHNPYISRILQRSRQGMEEKGILPKIEAHTNDRSIPLSPELQEVFQLCEAFCRSFGARQRGTGFLQTMLCRRIGSSLRAGIRTLERILNIESNPTDDNDDDNDEAEEKPTSKLAEKINEQERETLTEAYMLLRSRVSKDEKAGFCTQAVHQKKTEGILLFSQYFDTIESFAFQDWGETIAIYAGGNKSCLWDGTQKIPTTRADIKNKIRRREIRILFGTDAAAEGLNLQTLRHMVNIDCPWNPTRMEQRLGRIRRIGQLHDNVTVTNLRYEGSVEERVHKKLSERGEAIHGLFGTYPESFEDIWIEEVKGHTEKVKELIQKPLPNCAFLRKAEQTLETPQWGYAKEILDPKRIEAEFRNKW